LFFTLLLIGCGERKEGKEADNRINPPVVASDVENKNYKDVVTQFKDAGFTNVTTVENHVTTDQITKDGTVETVFINGSNSFSTDDKYEKSAEVIVRYYTADAATNSSEDAIGTESNPINLDNSPIFRKVMYFDIASNSDSYKDFFADKGKVIEFDGHVLYFSQHGDDETRFDVTILAQYNGNDIGPKFLYEDVSIQDMNLQDGVDTISPGIDVHVVAKINEYDETTVVVKLDPVSTTIVR
jgi:hypothetical protein